MVDRSCHVQGGKLKAGDCKIVTAQDSKKMPVSITSYSYFWIFGFFKHCAFFYLLFYSYHYHRRIISLEVSRLGCCER